MTAAAFGLAAIIATSASVLVWVKWLGVAYLAWIGLQLILSKPRESGPSAAQSARPALLFRQGFLTSSANRFAVVFFGALFPQFIDPGAPILPQLLVLGGTYLVVDGGILIIWAAVGSPDAWSPDMDDRRADQPPQRLLDDCGSDTVGQPRSGGRRNRKVSGITILDGGMGQELLARTGAKPTGLWATQVMIDPPEAVSAVHDSFFAAGAEIATTNTYAIHRDRP